MRKIMLLLYVVVTTLFASAVSSKEKSIVIQAPPTRAQWAGQIGRNLDNAIRYPQPLFGRPADSGVVSVVFIADQNGRASAARLVRSSQSKELDKAALNAIARMKSMQPMPEDVTDGQRIRANILFATSYADYTKQMKLLRAETTRFATRSALDKDTLVLNVRSGTSGGSGAKAR
ncbi:MAG TPA: TonB family protein [Sphingomonas sp.]|jgi:TonB family protein|nr:TonB family protein [Sphingomonas sp.]